MVAIAGGVLVFLAGVLVVATGRTWPTSRRYGGGARTAADGTAKVATSDRAVDDWDGLSRGDDPTEEDADPAPGGERPGDDEDDATDPSEPTR